MVLRRIGMSSLGSGGAEWLRRLNARHPWSHNDYFHSWILANLPEETSRALDVGCGRGELVTALAAHFTHVVGVDSDSAMRGVAGRSSGDLENVIIADRGLHSWRDNSFDLVTMIAVLHHLEIEAALRQVRRILAPRGRLLVVGLATPQSMRDYLWDSASILTNPLIGYVHHPWPSSSATRLPPFPVKDPVLGFGEIETIVREVLPDARMRHRLGFRHTIEWTKP